jgi:alpha-soluble NSF attachment protein
MAAKYEKELAEMWESELNYEEAIKHYESAADLYEGEDSKRSIIFQKNRLNLYFSTANGCWIKVAQYSAQLENYSKALEIYERVGKASLENKLLAPGARAHFLNAIICHLCNKVMSTLYSTSLLFEGFYWS